MHHEEAAASSLLRSEVFATGGRRDRRLANSHASGAMISESGKACANCTTRRKPYLGGWPRCGCAVLRAAKRKSPAMAGLSGEGAGDQSQLSAPPVWYSMTRVSKKLRSFFRSIISLIHGNGFSSWSNSASRPIWVARRLAMKRR